MRIGIGYDLHRLIPGRKLIIGGVDIPFEKGLLGHSDADVLIHAIIDSLLGAAALGDIGRHFKDTDPKWKDADSIMLLRTVGKMLSDKGYKVSNIDSNIIIQQPKMAPFIDLMRQNIADALGIDIDSVSVKAKTNEGVDSVGLGESAVANAVALIE